MAEQHIEESQEGMTDIQKKIILLTSANNTPITGKTWLQKELFLLSEAIDDFGKETNYVPYKFGPFSFSVQYNLEHLIKSKIISMDGNKICLTSNGEHIAKGLKSEEDSATIELIMDCKDFLNDLTEEEVLAYIYSAYPEMAVKSEVYAKIKPNTERCLLNLVEKEKISRGRTAEILGKDTIYVTEKLRERGYQIPLYS